jgi:hypothetical protein
MANVVEVPREDGSIGYKIRWRPGGGRTGAGCSETFSDSKQAARFKTGRLVGWPMGTRSALIPGGGRTRSNRFQRT